MALQDITCFFSGSCVFSTYFSIAMFFRIGKKLILNYILIYTGQSLTMLMGINITKPCDWLLVGLY